MISTKYKIAENIKNEDFHSTSSSNLAFINHFFAKREKLKHILNLSKEHVELELKKVELFSLFTGTQNGNWDFRDFSICEDSNRFYIYIGQIALPKLIGFTKEPLLKVNILIKSKYSNSELTWNRIDTWNSTISDEKSEIVVLSEKVYKLTVKVDFSEILSLIIEAYNFELKQWFKKTIKLDGINSKSEKSSGNYKLSCTKIDRNSIAVGYATTVWSINVTDWSLNRIAECNESILTLETRENSLNILTETNIYLVFIKLPRLAEIAQSVILSIK